MVVPTPTARPSTAATSGFFAVASVRRKRRTGAPSAPLVANVKKSLMSLPAEKTPPVPTIRLTTMSFDVSPELNASERSLYISVVIEFFFSGRLNLIVRTPASIAISIPIVIPCVSGGQHRIRGRLQCVGTGHHHT